MRGRRSAKKPKRTKGEREAASSEELVEDEERRRVSDGGVARIAEAIGRNRCLTYVDLTLNDIGDEGAECMAEALRCNTKLKSVRFEVGKPKGTWLMSKEGNEMRRRIEGKEDLEGERLMRERDE